MRDHIPKNKSNEAGRVCLRRSSGRGPCPGQPDSLSALDGPPVGCLVHEAPVRGTLVNGAVVLADARGRDARAGAGAARVAARDDVGALVAMVERLVVVVAAAVVVVAAAMRCDAMQGRDKDRKNRGGTK